MSTKFSMMNALNQSGYPYPNDPVRPPITGDLDMNSYDVLNVNDLYAKNIRADNILMVAPFTFTSGGILKSPYELVKKTSTGIYYYYVGSEALPIEVPINFNPEVSNNWKPFTGTGSSSDPINASDVVVDGGGTVQDFINASDKVTSIYYLSKYAGASTKVNDAWALLLQDIKPGYKFIVIDNNPNTSDGSWTMDRKCAVPNDCIIDMGHTLIRWNNQSKSQVTKRITGMFYGIGSVSFETTITANITEGSSVVTVADASNIVADDYIFVEINNYKDQTTYGIQYPLIFMFFRVKKVIGNAVYFCGKINWDVNLADQDTYSVKVIKKDDCAKNITICNVNILDEGVYGVNSIPAKLNDPLQPDYVIGPLFFQYCDNIHIMNAYGKNLKCPLIQIREGTRCIAEDCYSETPLAISAGEGYTVTMTRGSYYFQYRCGGYRTRHVCDFTSVYFGVMSDCWDDTEKNEILPFNLVSFFVHGRYDSEIVMNNMTTKNCVVIAGAGFSGFGNWLKHYKLLNSKIEQFGGRGAVGNCVLLNNEINEIVDTMVFEEITISNTKILTSISSLRREPRLSTVSPTNGVYITNSSKVRFSEFKDFDNVIFDSSSLHRIGGIQVQPVAVINVKNFKSSGANWNRKYVFTGSCENITFNSGGSLNYSNITGEEGGIVISDITSEKVNVTLSGRIFSDRTSLPELMQRPFTFKKGTGNAYDLNLNIIGLRVDGLWGGIGKIINDIGTVTGIATGNFYENTGAINYVDSVTGSRKPWPITFISSNNYYTDESRNFDNVNRIFSQSLDFGIINSNTEVGVIVNTPIWMDITSPAYVQACFNNIFPTNINIVAGIRNTTSNDLIVRVRNYSGTSQNIGNIPIIFNYSISK